MLTGEFRHTIDSKGRLFIPARWRPQLTEGVVISKGLERCLTIMSTEDFAAQAEKLDSLAFEKRPNRSYQRMLFSGTYEESLDKQGRITIPPALREYAGLGKEIVVIGAGRRGEVWSESAWSSYRESTESAYESIAEELEL